MNDAAKCQICAHPTIVVKVWLNAVGMRCRRRECRHCGFRWTTIEIVDPCAPVDIPAIEGGNRVSA